jgi:putative heme transporter
MSDAPPRTDGALRAAPEWLSTLGTRSWLFVGILALLAAASYLLTRSAAIVGPLLVAVILGILCTPIVAMLEHRGVPRAGGAGIVMLCVVAILGALTWVMVSAFASNFGAMQKEAIAGIEAARVLLASSQLPASLVDTIISVSTKAAAAVSKVLLGGVAGIADMVFAGFMAFYMLFYTLTDSDKLITWLGRHVGLTPKLGIEVVTDATESIRQYFMGTTIVALGTSAATWLGLVVFHIPFAVPIAIVTFATSYIPYLGVVIATIFTALLALGAGGVPMMITALIIVILVQNVLEAPLVGWAVGSALELHPLAVITSTLLGGVFGGMWGALLASPLLAIGVRTNARLKAAKEGALGADEFGDAQDTALVEQAPATS